MQWSLLHPFHSDLWLWWINTEWVKISVKCNLNKQLRHSTHAFLICPNSSKAQGPSKKNMAHLLNPGGGEDFEPSVTLTRWAAPLSQVSLHTHVHKCLEVKSVGTSPLRGRRTTEDHHPPVCCALLLLLLLLLCCPFAPRWTTGRPTAGAI